MIHKENSYSVIRDKVYACVFGDKIVFRLLFEKKGKKKENLSVFLKQFFLDFIKQKLPRTSKKKLRQNSLQPDLSSKSGKCQWLTKIVR